jgi:outer membrane autotransporter protein
MKLTQPKLTVLHLAISTALAAMSPSVVVAQTVISSNETTTQSWSSDDFTVNNGASVIVSGNTAVSATGVLGIFSNSGYISGEDGIVNSGTISTLNNSGGIAGSVNTAINNQSEIGTLTNNGTLFADNNHAMVNAGHITELVNNRSIISNNGSGIINLKTSIGSTSGVIDTLTNSDAIFGKDKGIDNVGGTITTLTNDGTITGDNYGIENDTGVISTLNNSGIIRSENSAITNDGLITDLNNKTNGRIEGGIANGSSGEITNLDNKGTITASSSTLVLYIPYAVYNEGAIGTLNNSGLISSTVDAIFLDAGSTLGTFINSGKVAGTITNQSGQSLSIQGGSGSTFGVLTGASGGIGAADIGLIHSPNAYVVFGPGNQLLNDHVNVVGNTVGNEGGVLQVNNHINITGDYSQNSAATLNIGVSNGALANGVISDVGYGRLIVSGNATIDVGSSVMLKKVSSYDFAKGQRYLVIQANSTGTNYNEATLQYGATGFNGTISGSSIVDGSNLDLILTLDGGTANLATNSDAQSALDGLFQYTGTDPALMNLFNAAAAAANSTEEGSRTGSQLSPTSSKSSVAGASNTVSQQVNNIAFNRLDNSPSAPSPSGLSGGDGISNKAGWGQAFAGRASDDGRDGVSGYHASYAGLLLGADTELNAQWRAGGLFSYAATSVSSDGNNAGSYANVDSYGLTAYTGFTGEPWYVNLAAGAARSDVEAHRLVNITGFNGIASSNYKGMQYIAAAQAGYPLNIDHVLPGAVLTPLAGLTYSSLSQDGYTETGGNGAALTVGATDTHSVKSDLGFKLERAYKTSHGLLKPTVQLVWRHEYCDTRMQSVANFAADTSGATTFVSQGAKPISDTGVLILGATLLRNDNLTLSANYTLETGGGYTAQTGSLLARWRF